MLGIKTEIFKSIREIEHNYNLEVVLAELTTLMDSKIIICSCYRPPNADRIWMENVSNFINNVCSRHRLRIHRCATRYTSPMISLSHGLRHFHTHFWQVHLFEFQYKCITEKCILPFYKRPGQKHNFICCLKCAGQLPFINICEPRQSCGKFS